MADGTQKPRPSCFGRGSTNEHLVGEVGLEPTSLAATDFKSVVYTNSTTRPGGTYRIRTGVQGFADLCLTTRPRRLVVETSCQLTKYAQAYSSSLYEVSPRETTNSLEAWFVVSYCFASVMRDM
jgi:hypothetical protein